MNRTEQIKKALIAKNYKPDVVEFEPISYYSTGREGGWTIGVVFDDTTDELFPDWSKIKIPTGLIADIFECDFMCFNYKDALKVIDLLPSYPIFVTTYDD